jgi:hypothetical protein
MLYILFISFELTLSLMICKSGFCLNETQSLAVYEILIDGKIACDDTLQSSILENTTSTLLVRLATQISSLFELKYCRILHHPTQYAGFYIPMQGALAWDSCVNDDSLQCINVTSGPLNTNCYSDESILVECTNDWYHVIYPCLNGSDCSFLGYIEEFFPQLMVGGFEILNDHQYLWLGSVKFSETLNNTLSVLSPFGWYIACGSTVSNSSDFPAVVCGNFDNNTIPFTNTLQASSEIFRYFGDQDDKFKCPSPVPQQIITPVNCTYSLYLCENLAQLWCNKNCTALDSTKCGFPEICVDGMCQCASGYQRTGPNCTDINECQNANSCLVSQECINLNGGYFCRNYVVANITYSMKLMIF